MRRKGHVGIRSRVNKDYRYNRPELLSTQAAVLLALREGLNLKLTAMSNGVGIQRTRLHRLETGRAEITYAEVLAFERWLGRDLFTPEERVRHEIDASTWRFLDRRKYGQQKRKDRRAA